MLSYHHLGLSPFDATTPIRSMSSVDCMSTSEFPCHLLSCSEVVRPSSVFGHGEQATISYCPTFPARAIAVTGINKMTMTAEHLFFVSPKPKKTKDQRPKTPSRNQKEQPELAQQRTNPNGNCKRNTKSNQDSQRIIAGLIHLAISFVPLLFPSTSVSTHRPHSHSILDQRTLFLNSDPALDS